MKKQFPTQANPAHGKFLIPLLLAAAYVAILLEPPQAIHPAKAAASEAKATPAGSTIPTGTNPLHPPVISPHSANSPGSPSVSPGNSRLLTTHFASMAALLPMPLHLPSIKTPNLNFYP